MRGTFFGCIAQLARACGSYPQCQWFESTYSHHCLFRLPWGAGKDVYGPMVKRLRHRPFTAVTRVRVPYGSPYGGIAQPVERLLHTQEVTDSSSVVSTTKTPEIFGFWVFFFAFRHKNWRIWKMSRKCPVRCPAATRSWSP